MKMSASVRAHLADVSKRWRESGVQMCWKCLEWHPDLREIECRGWLCSSCQKTQPQEKK